MASNRPLVTIHNATTGETETRPMNDAEYAQYQTDQAAAAEAKAAAEAAAAKKAAILAALADATGYSADELKEALNA